MQVLTPPRRSPGAPGLRAVVVGCVASALLFLAAVALGWLVVGTPILSQFNAGGRATPAQLVGGMAAWTLALVGPAGFGLFGVAKLAATLDAISARRPVRTPGLQAREALGSNHAVAVGVFVPGAARRIQEMVVGPYGVAILVELPPARITRRQGRTWEVRIGGRWRTIDNPLERAARDAEAVRHWFDEDETDRVVKVYAAVVGEIPGLERTSDCAVIRPSEVAGWIAALPAQRLLTPERLTQVISQVRSAAA
jgi:hypothetical protein